MLQLFAELTNVLSVACHLNGTGRDDLGEVDTFRKKRGTVKRPCNGKQSQPDGDRQRTCLNKGLLKATTVSALKKAQAGSRKSE